MMVAAQCVADQNGIAARGVQFTVGLVNHIVFRQAAAAGQYQRLIEMQRLRLDNAYAVWLLRWVLCHLIALSLVAVFSRNGKFCR